MYSIFNVIKVRVSASLTVNSTVQLWVRVRVR